MRYIKKFTTVHKSKGFILDDTNTPNISLIEELVASTGGLRTTQKLPPHDYAADYLTIKVEETRKFHFAPMAGTISYSLDYGTTWSEPSNDVITPFVEAGDKILIKGNLNFNSTYVDEYEDEHSIDVPNLFPVSSAAGGGSDSGWGGSDDSGEPDTPEVDPDFVGKYSIEGNLMSLFYGDGFNTPGTVASGFAVDEDPTKVPGYDLTKCIAKSDFSNKPFSKLFANDTELKSAKHLILPAQILKANCYGDMFNKCTSLTEAPALPATTLADSCYFGMFEDCESLTEAPALPATTLAYSCYQVMFMGCSSLVTPPVLPATTLVANCYHAMFQWCESLTEAPALPATTLARECYESMFLGCSSLATAPELPATTLANDCYKTMFNKCTSLTEAPELPATELAEHCYDHMFYDCTSLTTPPTILPATTLTACCYESMFEYCSSLATAPELPATTLDGYCYKHMFYCCTSLTTAPELPATILGGYCYDSMFYNCTSLNYVKCLATDISGTRCTAMWLYGVSSEGTFVKDTNMNDWTNGSNGIPEGWTVQNA